MWLINTHSWKLEEHNEQDGPKYAILSHTWDLEEVNFGTMMQCPSQEYLVSRKGGRKLVRFCEMAASRGLQLAWMDTCCIDKSSSAELSEAINSMFRWYQRSHECYAYLPDVKKPTNGSLSPDFASSRWFTRGWTLQELLAPRSLLFFGQNWELLGHKKDLLETLAYATRIAPYFLKHPYKGSNAQRMCWAAKRVTTRPEDIAYSLLGLFDVNMPLLYGEGAKKAFHRLQYEIVANTNDDSILAWNSRGGHKESSYLQLAASHPVEFQGCDNVFVINPMPSFVDFSLTKKALRITGSMAIRQLDHDNKMVVIPLNSKLSESQDSSKQLCLILNTIDGTNVCFREECVAGNLVSGTADKVMSCKAIDPSAFSVSQRGEELGGWYWPVNSTYDEFEDPDEASAFRTMLC